MVLYGYHQHCTASIFMVMMCVAVRKAVAIITCFKLPIKRDLLLNYVALLRNSLSFGILIFQWSKLLKSRMLPCLYSLRKSINLPTRARAKASD